MSDEIYTQEDRELIHELVKGILDGRLQPSDFVKLEPDQIADGWRHGVAMLSANKVDEKLLLALSILQAADPDFPSGHFVLGLAHEHLGNLDHARYHLERQLELEKELHHRECRVLLDEIENRGN